MKKSKTDFFKRLGLKLRDCRRKRHFIFEDMPEITGLTPLNVMLLECGKKRTLQLDAGTTLDLP